VTITSSKTISLNLSDQVLLNVIHLVIWYYILVSSCSTSKKTKFITHAREKAE